MSTQKVSMSPTDSTPSSDVKPLRNRAEEMDAETFSGLCDADQNHVLWKLSREIPFRYARRGHNRMRRYLAGGVVSRCKVNSILFETFPRIYEFRQNKGRAYCDFTGMKTQLFVDFHVYNTSSEYNVTEADISHELMHSMLQANDIRISSKAFRRDGRTDRAWYHNGGFPNWDFEGKDVPATTYLHQTDGCESQLVSTDVLEDMLSKRLAEYDETGLHSGVSEEHARDGRANPFEDEISVQTPENDREAFLMLVGEADIAWYTTAKAFSEGYEEVARASVFWDSYTATNPSEMLCKFHEFFQKPGSYAGTHAKIEQAMERHPWLLKRYLNCFEPHSDKAKALTAVMDT